jgi:hypothetical protein
MKNTDIKTAAIYAPGKAIFGTCLLDLTSKAWDLGINLTGADIRKAWPADTGGVWLEGACEDKHYTIAGDIAN